MTRRSLRVRCPSSRPMLRAILVLVLLQIPLGAADEPKGLTLHPENPRYFQFRGKPALLISSGEHYGAVLNLDFDYKRYLDELHSKGLNHTRTFSGVYREIPGSFGITDNTLAPFPGRYAAPWARSTTPGYFDGGAKFDLSRWDDSYFQRLVDFVREAGRRGIVVELDLFCPMYEDSLWKACPMNAENNVNGVGKCAREEVYTLKHPDLLAVQLAVTRKIVEALREEDSLYYEVCNEPYFGGVTMEWQERIAETITEVEKAFPSRHLISLNIANGSAKVEKPHPAISIFNFHYAVPPDAVALNYGLKKPIGENETGFRGKEDVLYRTEGWDFLLAGGALYNNLDYSFTSRHPDGSFRSYTSPGGGSPELRSQLKVLKDFLHGFDFIRMAPDPAVVKGGVPEGLRARALSEPGKAYAVYVHAPFGSQTFSARWTGRLEPRHSEATTFHTLSNDGVRLWVDGRLVIDNWTDHAATEDKGSIALESGKAVDLKVEFFQAGGSAVLKLYWSSPSLKREIVPEASLTLPDGGRKGLKAEYFEDKDLKRLAETRTDPTIEFDWSKKQPPGAGRSWKIDLTLDLAAGAYRAEWLGTRSGKVEKSEDLEHAGGARRLASPEFTEDIALGVKRK